MFSGKDERSVVITCSTFVNPESSIKDTHSPLMNASPLIRLYFDILSKECVESSLLSDSSLLKKIYSMTFSFNSHAGE